MTWQVRKEKPMKKLLAMLSVVFFANQASADDGSKAVIDDVFFCSTDFYYGWHLDVPDNSMHRLKNFSFSFKYVEGISMNLIQFGASEGYFSGQVTALPVLDEHSMYGTIFAQDEYSTFVLLNYMPIIKTRIFTFASANPIAFTTIKGTCEKF